MNYLLWSLFGPATWSLWGFLAAAVARHTERFSASRLLFTVSLLWLWLASTPLVANALVRPLEAAAEAAAQNPPDRIDGIILLAGSEDTGAWSPSRGLQLRSAGDRFTTALTLAHHHKRARVLFMGGSRGAGEPDEGVVAQAFLEPLLGRRLVVVGDTIDTCDNARGARDSGVIGDGEHWLLVTSAFHMPRALACFEQLALTVHASSADFRAPPPDAPRFRWPADLVPGPATLEDTNLALHEWIGLLWYRLNGRIGAIPDFWGV